LLRTPASRWESGVEAAAARLRGETPFTRSNPKIRLAADEKFFCIGSCFARNIEEVLTCNDLDVLSRKIICPKEEWPARPNGLVNKFTTPSILNEIEWMLGLTQFDQNFLHLTEKGYLDLQLCPGVREVSLERALERR